MCLTFVLLDIGNARVAGMENDLHLTSDQFEWLLRTYFNTCLHQKGF